RATTTGRFRCTDWLATRGLLEFEDDVQPVVRVVGPGRLDAVPVVLLASVEGPRGPHLVEQDVGDLELVEHTHDVAQREITRPPVLALHVEDEAAPAIPDAAGVARLGGNRERAAGM